METDIWQLYEEGRNYCRMMGIFTDTDRNYRMYNGNQWHGLRVSGIEPVQLNFIKPIVKYKVGTINANQYAINFSAENYDNEEFREVAIKTCELLNRRASKVWEKDKMDFKIRRVSKDSAINDEGIIYITYDTELDMPKTELIDKNDIFYGNENSDDMQEQPYVLIKQRMPVSSLKLLAESEGIKGEKLTYIIGDNDTFEETGDDAKYEKDDMATLVTKLYKKNGTVHYSKATRFVTLKEETDSGLTLYPVAHMVWEEKKGSARGEGEVRHLIPNQLEVNKTIMRRLLVAKSTAYPQKVAHIDKIANPEAINTIGGIIKVKGQEVQDVRQIFYNTQPAQMSSDVEKVMTELITHTRELSGAGDVATGDIDPEKASGKAILAVQQAQQAPLTEQLVSLKNLLEDVAKIWLDMWRVYATEGLQLEEEETDLITGEESVELVSVPPTVLQELQASVKIDITPKGAFDKYAQEQSIESLLTNGMINLEEYVDALDEDSVMPKSKLEKILEKRKEAQMRIAQINNRARLLQQNIQQQMNNGNIQPDVGQGVEADMMQNNNPNVVNPNMQMPQ